MVEPAIPVESFVDWFGNRAARIMAPAGPLRIRYDNVVTDSGSPEPTIEGLPLVPVRRAAPRVPAATCSRAATARWTG